METQTNEQLTFTTTNSMNNGDVNISQAEAAQRYIEWHTHHVPPTVWDKAFAACRHCMPDWFLFSALVVGIITLGVVILKFNPALEPVKNMVIWLLKFWETILESGKSLIGKK
jgi:hypothetical protein